MKNLFILLVCFLFVFANQLYAQRSNCSAYPGLVHVTQPNGSNVELYMQGNEAYHYYQTVDGYTVLQNPQNNGQYEYVTIDATGDMVASGIAVGSI